MEPDRLGVGPGYAAGAPPPTILDTLVADLAAVLDSLRLGQVVLVGHSIAGEEMTRFAELYGSRCAGLVYLELLGHTDLRTTMIYTHVLNRGGLGVRSPVDRL